MRKVRFFYKKHLIIFLFACVIAVLSYCFPEFFEQFKVDTTKQEKQLSDYKEKDFVNDNCPGIKEYRLPDKTRVDCLTETYAIEFDYAKKWAESIGQAKYYAKKTGKKPAVAIIMKSPDDEKYIKRIRETEPDIVIMKIKAYN